MLPASFHNVAVPVIAAAIGAAVGSVVTAVFTPIGKLAWEAFRRRRFDPKRAHYNELVEESKWYETRAVKLATFRQQLQLSPPADRFRLSEMISKLDARDAEWVRRADLSELVDATADKERECLDNASECAQYANDVQRKIFW